MDAALVVAFGAAGAAAGWAAPQLAARVAEPRYGPGSDAYDPEDEALGLLSGFGGAPLRIASTALLAAGAAGLALRYGRVAPVAVAVLLAVAIAVACIVDLRYLRLPDVLTLGSAAGAAVAVAVVTPTMGLPGGAVRTALTAAAIGAVAFAGFLLVVSVAFQLVTRRSGMGLGDVKLALPLGLVLGWFGGSGFDAVAMVIWAAMAGNLLGIVGGLVVTRLRPGREFPFGPFLALGWLVVLVVQPLR